MLLDSYDSHHEEYGKFIIPYYTNENLICEECGSRLSIENICLNCGLVSEEPVYTINKLLFQPINELKRPIFKKSEINTNPHLTRLLYLNNLELYHHNYKISHKVEFISALKNLKIPNEYLAFETIFKELDNISQKYCVYNRKSLFFVLLFKYCRENNLPITIKEIIHNCKEYATNDISNKRINEYVKKYNIQINHVLCIDKTKKIFINYCNERIKNPKLYDIFLEDFNSVYKIISKVHKSQDCNTYAFSIFFILCKKNGIYCTQDSGQISSVTLRTVISEFINYDIKIKNTWNIWQNKNK